MGGKVVKSIKGTAYSRKDKQPSDWLPASQCHKHQFCISCDEICNWSIDQDYSSSTQATSLYTLTTDNPVKDVTTYTSIIINCREKQLPVILYDTLRDSANTLLSLAIRGLPVGCRACIYEFFRRFCFSDFSMLQQLVLSRSYMDECYVRLDEFEFPSKLTHLTLYGLGLVAVPPSLAKLTELEHLCLSNNVLTSLGDIVTSGKLLQLTILDLSKNCLTTLPSELSSLSQITVLDLSNNCIKKALPDELGHLVNLVELYLEWNRIERITTEVMFQLGRLTLLDLSNNKLKSVSPSVLFHPSLVFLNLSGNTDLTYDDDVTDSAGLESHIEELDVSNTCLNDLPSRFSHLCRLKVFTCDNNYLSDIAAISGLTNLQLISVKSNCFDSLDSFSTLVSKLNFPCTIDLVKNKISTVPEFMSHCQSVQLLLDENCIPTAEEDQIPYSATRTKLVKKNNLFSRLRCFLSPADT